MSNQIYVIEYAIPHVQKSVIRETSHHVYLGVIGDTLCLCDWVDRKGASKVRARLEAFFGAQIVQKKVDYHACVKAELDQYFSGERQIFDVTLALAGTDFQMQVWHALQSIPYGRTWSYSELAKKIGRPSAVRAVANANGANAVSIMVPCHRVIGANQTLTGYAGGLPMKRQLLALEEAIG